MGLSDYTRAERLELTRALAHVHPATGAIGRYVALGAAVARKPDEWVYWYALGSLHLSEGELTRAIRACEKCYELKPDDPRSAFALASALRGLTWANHEIPDDMDWPLPIIPAESRKALQELGLTAEQALQKAIRLFREVLDLGVRGSDKRVVEESLAMLGRQALSAGKGSDPAPQARSKATKRQFILPAVIVAVIIIGVTLAGTVGKGGGTGRQPTSNLTDYSTATATRAAALPPSAGPTVGATATFTPSPTATNRPTVLSPTYTASPLPTRVALPCLPTIGTPLLETENEKQAFIQQVREAEKLLQNDSVAYERYCTVAALARSSRGYVCLGDLIGDLDKHVAARANLGAMKGVSFISCPIEVSKKGAFYEGKAKREQQLILAAILSHEATHLARAPGGLQGKWQARFDRAWLAEKKEEGLTKVRAVRSQEFVTALQQERKEAYAKIEAEANSARAQALAKLNADVDAEIQKILAKYPNLTPTQWAEIEAARADAIATGRAEIEASLAADVAMAKARVEEALSSALLGTDAMVQEKLTEWQSRDWIGEYLKTDELVNEGTASESGKEEVIREECWARSEELYTFTKIGGTDPEDILQLALFLTTSECTKHLNLR